MAKMHIKAADGFKVRDPATGEMLPSKGARVDPTEHWKRCLGAGIVVDLDAGKPKPEPEPEPDGEEKEPASPSGGKRKK